MVGDEPGYFRHAQPTYSFASASHPTSWSTAESATALQLFPGHPARPALQAIQVSADAVEGPGWQSWRIIQDFLPTVRAADSITCLALLPSMSKSPTVDHYAMAELLLAAGDDERLDPDQLASA